jgi:type II secretory pathway pseudopilin PulG
VSQSRFQGFALLEAVAAIAIIGIVALSTLELLRQQIESSQHIEPALIAAEVGRQKLMAARLANPRALGALPDSLTAGIVLDGSGQYFWRVTLDAYPNHQHLGLLSVEVRGPGAFEAKTLLELDPALSAAR